MFLSSFARRALHFLGKNARLALLLGAFGVSALNAQAQIIFTNFFFFTNTVQLTTNAYSVSESGGYIEIAVQRIPDPLSDFSLQDDITVDYETSDGTAQSLVDYKSVSGTLEFKPLQELAYFTIPIYDNNLVDGARTVNIVIRNARVNNNFGFGGDQAVLGSPSAAILTITDDDGVSNPAAAGSIQWSAASYEVFHDESDPGIAHGDNSPLGAVVTLVRPGGTKGKILVDWQTSTNGIRGPRFDTNFGFFFFFNQSAPAVPGQNFNQIGGTVEFNDFQMSANVVIPVLKNPTASSPYDTNLFADFTTDWQFKVQITNVRVAPGEDPAVVIPQIGARSEAVVNLRNNQYGLGFAFERAHYTFNEGTPAIEVWVKRSPNPNPPARAVSVHYTQNPLNVVGDYLWNTWPLDASSDYATPFVDFEPSPTANDRLEWSETDGDLKKRIVIPIYNDSEVEFNEDIYLYLYKLPGETDGFINPSAGRCHATIRFDDQPAGSYDRTFNLDNSSATVPPFNAAPGANFDVNAVAAQPDGKVIVGGDFDKINTTPQGHIGRMNNNGTLDTTFAQGLGTGADRSVHAVALQPDGKVIIGGDFTSINGASRYGIARLNTNGTVDVSFNPGLGTRDSQAQEATVRAIAVLDSGKILIGGDFTTVNGTNATYLARLNSDGSLDTSFTPGRGPDGPIYSIALGTSRMEIKGKSFGGPSEQHFGPYDSGSTSGTITINYTLVDPSQLRIHYDGNVIFDSGIATNSQSVTVPYSGNSTLIEVAMNETPSIPPGRWFFTLTINPDTDQRPVIGGNFTTYDGAPANYITRLTPDGVLDPAFNKIGTGADNVVYSVAKQGNKIIMGGSFTSVDLRSRNGIARLNESGALDTSYTPGSGANDIVYTVAQDINGKALMGGLFTSINSSRRVGIARLNYDGTVDTTFMDTAYNQFAGLINQFSPEVSPENFLSTMAPYRLTNITVLTNLVVNIATGETNQIVVTNVSLKDQVFIGGHFSRIGGGFLRDDVRRQTSISRLIGGETPGPGNIGFVQTTYTADEASGGAFITLVRTNGSLGEAHATFGTAAFPAGPGIATPGADYTPGNKIALWDSTYAQGTDRHYSAARMGPNYLSFDTNRAAGDFTNYIFPATPSLRVADNSNNKVFVGIIDDTLIEGDELADMKLATPGNALQLGGVPIPAGTALGLAEANLVIADNDFNYGTIGFSSPTFTVNEGDGTALVTVTRVGGVAGLASVHYETQNGTAEAGLDYLRTSGDLTFDSGKDTATFRVPIIDDTRAELDETINVLLSRPNGLAVLDPSRTNSVITIIDNDFAPGRVSYLSPTLSVNEGDGTLTVTVQRRGGSLGDATVNFSTADGTALAGINYVSTNGVFHWVSGDTSSRTFTVKIIPNDIIEAANKNFTVVLTNPIISSNPDPRLLGNVPIATVTIVNDDFSGGFAFSQPLYSVDENGGEAIITVLRQGGSAGTNQVYYTVTNLVSGGAIPGKDFTPITGVLNFGSNEISKSFIVPIVDNTEVDGDRGIQLSLSKPAAGSIISSNSTLMIIDNELGRIPAGTVDTGFNATGTDDFIYSVGQQKDQSLLIAGDFIFINNIARNRIARLLPDGTVDSGFDPALGANGSIRSIAFENDNRIVLGGLFTSVNGTNRNYLARLNVNASSDPTFNPGSGTDNPIYALAVQDDGKIIAVGAFASFNGQPRNSVVRLLTNGLIDPFFTPGTGANAPIYSLALQSDGKVLLGGGFTTFNGTSVSNLVRLKRDGTIDPTFSPLAAPDGSVRAITLQSDGKIVIGGLFHHVAGQALNEIARLNSDGTIDSDFHPGAGADGSVGVIRVQIDGKLLLGGDFTHFDGVSRSRITRLNPDGSNDPTINFGSGADSTVEDILIQQDRKIVVVGGFTHFNGQPRNHIVRIHGGSLSGAGAVEFTSGNFNVEETGTNAVITLRRSGGTTGQITVDYQTTSGTAVAGQDYTAVQGTVTFPTGETEATLYVPVFVNRSTPGDKSFGVALSNPGQGAALGLQPSTIVTITSEYSVIEFDRPSYSATEQSQIVAVTVRREGATSGSASVNVYTSDITAREGFNYSGINQTLVFAPGDTSKTFSIPVIDDKIVDFDKTFSVNLTNVSSSSGQVVLGAISNALVTVINVQVAPGNLGFASTTYSVVEGNEGTRTNAAITVRRTGGASGVVSIDFATTTNGTAAVNTKYIPTSGTLSFADGETEKSFLIQIIGNNIVEGNQSVGLKLSNPQGGSTLVGSPTAVLTIVDDDFGPGSVDLSFDPGTGATSGAVRALVLESSGTMLIGGDFTNYNGTSRSHVARITGNGSLDPTFNSGTVLNGSVAALGFQGDEVLVAGGFTMANSLILQRVARLTATGVLDPGFRLPLGFNNEVSAIAVQGDGSVLVGGLFDQASAAGRNHIARLTSTGTVDSTFNVGSGTDRSVNAIALDANQNVLIGGAFATYNGISRAGIARLRPTGTLDTSFLATGVNGNVNVIRVLQDGKILIAGDFTSVNGTNRSRIARLNSNGSLDLSFNPPTIDQAIRTLDVQTDGKIFIGGDFTTLNNVARNRVARLNADGSIESGELGSQFNPGAGANDRVWDLAIQGDGKVVIVGGFTTVDGIPRRGIARLNGDRVLQPVIDLATVRRVNGQITFTFSSEAGRNYIIERSTDFQTWDRVTGINAQSSTSTFTESSGSSLEFYRVRLAL